MNEKEKEEGEGEGEEEEEEEEREGEGEEGEGKGEKEDEQMEKALTEIEDKDAQIKELMKEIESLKTVKTTLEGKIDNFKATVTKIKEKFDIELKKKDTKYNELQKSYEKIFLEQQKKLKDYEGKIKNLQTDITKQKLNIIESEEVIIEENEKIEELISQLSNAKQIIKSKNDQMRLNEKYSLELISINKDLKNQLSYPLKFEKNSNVINQLNKQINILNHKLKADKKKIENLEIKNSKLEETNIKLKSSITQNKIIELLNTNPQDQFANLNTSNHNSFNFEPKKFIKGENLKQNDVFWEYNNVIKQREKMNSANIQHKGKIMLMTSQNESDDYLVSEMALPKIFPRGGSAKNDTSFKYTTYAPKENYQPTIMEINQLMGEIIDQSKQ